MATAAQCVSLLPDTLLRSLHRMIYRLAPSRLHPFLLIVAMSATLATAPVAAADMLPPFEQVKAGYIASDALLLDRHGEPLADLRLNPTVRRLRWVELHSLPPAMREALLAAEDKRFFQHTGIDWKAFLGAAWQNLWGHTKRGASTLTMQLAGLLEPRLHLPDRGAARRSLAQKWDQSLAALELERRWTKEQILEAYLNLAPFRGDLEGVGAASQILLGVTPEAITRREAVIIAALLRGPNARISVVTRRACVLAELLKDKKQCAAIGQLAQARLDAPRNVPRFGLAPHLARELLRQPGQQVSTTLDANMQKTLLGVLARLSAYPHQQTAAGMVLDNASGEVLAWAGGLDARGPDALLARQTLVQWWQPFSVSLGIEQRTHTAASLLIDTRAVLDVRDTRKGQNASVISLRGALQTRNAGALREQTRELVHELGVDALQDRLRQLGLEPPANADAAVSDLTPVQLAAAWRSLAAGGNFMPASPLPQDAAFMHKAGNPGAAFIAQDMLADNAVGGWRSSWQLHSIDWRQQTVVGNTDRFTIVVTLTRTERADDVARNAQLLWRDVASVIQKEPSRAPAAPDGVVSSLVVFEPPEEPVRREWFLRGTELDHVMADALPTGARLRIPVNGQAYVVTQPPQPWSLDAAVAKATRWMLDGHLIGQGARPNWTPSLGHHRVTLLGPRDEVLDSADFDVITH